MAPQLIFTRGVSRRGLLSWMALTTTPLPVPVSPQMSRSTLSFSARMATLRQMRWMASLSPTICRGRWRMSSRLRRRFS